MKLIFVLMLLFLKLASASDLKFEKKKIHLKNMTLTVEIADTPEKQEQGLMFRQKLKDGEGMLFVFPEESERNFWMKNTFVDLSIGYFNKKKKLINIVDMTAVKSEMESALPVYPSKGPAQFALEVPKGWFLKHKIKLGDKLVLD